MEAKPSRIQLSYAAILAAIGWFALIVQVSLVVNKALAIGVSVLSAEVRVFSFFTVLTNILVASLLTAQVFWPASVVGRFLTRPTVQAAVAMYIIVVGVIYNLMLRNVWKPEGWQKVADELFHDVVPVAYVVYWLIWAPKGFTSWKDPFRWLSYPVAYAVYSLIRGAVTELYPYPFINVAKLGYPRVLGNMAVLVIAILCLGFVIVEIDRWLGKLAARRAQDAARS